MADPTNMDELKIYAAKKGVDTALLIGTLAIAGVISLLLALSFLGGNLTTWVSMIP